MDFSSSTFPVNGVYNTPAAPAPTGATPQTTAQAATTGAIGTGLQVYSQLPGYQASVANIGNAIQSETAGQVPDDVIAQLKQQGAEGNVTTGAASNAAYLKALGLTSLGLQQSAASELTQQTQALPGANIAANPAYYQTQQQSYDAGLQQQVFQLQQQQQSEQIQQQQEALQVAQQASAPTSKWASGPYNGNYFTPAGSTQSFPVSSAY